MIGRRALCAGGREDQQAGQLRRDVPQSLEVGPHLQYVRRRSIVQGFRHGEALYREKGRGALARPTPRCPVGLTCWWLVAGG